METGAAVPNDSACCILVGVHCKERREQLHVKTVFCQVLYECILNNQVSEVICSNFPGYFILENSIWFRVLIGPH